ncbi:hypothetical protein GOBAR_AA35486 [Gossypium barbadense]|uniref:Uncharacterized protein n=1 Tax=Gossypium barbadense TaxID=3634 RepID=A0A2P5W283_GOSBA|nr:hypothetical protein GOBAR_AA35486 [Gossypium barbadense]
MTRNSDRPAIQTNLRATTSAQDKEGFIAPEPELQRDNAMNEGREELNDDDPKQHTWLGTRACLKPWPNRGRDMAVRDDRVKVGNDFPKTRDAINPHGRAMWPWLNLIEEHGHARDKLYRTPKLIITQELQLHRGRTYGLMNVYDCRSILLHSQTDHFPKL